MPRALTNSRGYAVLNHKLSLGRTELDTYFFLTTPHYAATLFVHTHCQYKLVRQLCGRGIDNLGPLFRISFTMHFPNAVPAAVYTNPGT